MKELRYIDWDGRWELVNERAFEAYSMSWGPEYAYPAYMDVKPSELVNTGFEELRAPSEGKRWELWRHVINGTHVDWEWRHAA